MKILYLSIISVLVVVMLLPFNAISAQNDSKPTIYFDHPNYATEKMSCYYYETGKMLLQGQAPKKAVITVTDPSANKFSTSIDRVTIFVWSDSDKKGIEITAYETDVNSSIFKGTVTISEGQSTQGVIHVSDGDTLWAKYAGTAPWTPDTTNGGITTTVFIGALCAPLERVPASGIKITDSDGNELKTVLAGRQIQIGSNLSNPTIRNQNFTYIVQIYDKDDNNPESLSWLSGMLLPSKTLSSAVSWTPTRAGSYTVQVFVWQSISNPNSLSPPLSTSLTVLPSLSTYGSSATSVENIRCYLGYEPVIKPSNNSTVCVTSQSAQKLVKRGWAERTTDALEANRAKPPVDILSAQLLGSEIELMLKNTSMKPLTALGAALECRNTTLPFDFRVTESSPMMPGYFSISDTELPPGIGNANGLTCPIKMDGIMDNKRFSYSSSVKIAWPSPHGGPSPMPITVWGKQDTLGHARKVTGMPWVSLPAKIPQNLTLAPIRVQNGSAVAKISAVYTPPGVSTSDNVTGDQVADAGGFSVTYWKEIAGPTGNMTRQMGEVAKEFPNATSLDIINGHQALVFANEIQINAGTCMGMTNCWLMIDIGSRTLDSVELRPIAESIVVPPYCC